MKRSKKAMLVVMASVSVIAGCDSEAPESAHVFRNMQQCESYYNKNVCLEKHKIAESSHRQSAPKFQDKKDCEATFNNCSYGSGGYIPIMNGFMTPSNIQDNNTRLQTQPLYGSGNNIKTASGMSFANTGANKVRPSSFQRPVSSTYVSKGSSVSRGGFGSTSARFSSSGG